jgi:SAM-dependent methyltransferase
VTVSGTLAVTCGAPSARSPSSSCRAIGGRVIRLVLGCRVVEDPPPPRSIDTEPSDTAPSDPVFRDVDATDGDVLVAMMDATDAWPAVQAAREWIRRVTRTESTERRVLDLGSGPGTFNGATLASCTVDVDRSMVMSRTARRRHPSTLAVVADMAGVPFADHVADLVHVERALQWTADPDAALSEAARLVAVDGWLAVTDTDWSTFTVSLAPGSTGDDGAWARAAPRWVPHGHLAPELRDRLVDLGLTDVAHRSDRVVLNEWDPDDTAQHDGPPGLPLRAIAATAGPNAASLSAQVDQLADLARAGSFRAELTLVSAVGRRPA